VWDNTGDGGRLGQGRPAKGRQLHLGSFPQARPAAVCAPAPAPPARVHAQARVHRMPQISQAAAGLACEACQPVRRCGLELVQPWRAPACQHARATLTSVRDTALNTRVPRSAYDRAALYIRGPSAVLNFPDTEYAQDAFMQVPCWAAVRASQGAGVTVTPQACVLCFCGSFVLRQALQATSVL
jgi:hypothetical protein